jgi:hypothetical protein
MKTCRVSKVAGSFFRLDDELLRLSAMHDLAITSDHGGHGLPRWLSIMDLQSINSIMGLMSILRIVYFWPKSFR